MTLAANDSRSPALFAHTTRKDWGVGVLAWEAGGKRGYLFENGEERTMASGFFELMRKVEQPSPDESAAYARLQGILAARASANATNRLGASFSDQVAKFRDIYAGGLQDGRWVVEVRGEGAERRAPRHRDAMIREAQEKLAPAALDAFISAQRYDQAWEQITSVLAHTDLVPAAQLKKPKVIDPEQQKALVLAAREVLYGKAPYEQRFERYLTALAAYFGEPARWEISTALAALVYPTEHVCVHPAIFRQQLKSSGSRGTVAARPSSAGYSRLLIVARFVGSQLVDQGEAPRDLLDVHDFIQVTLKPPTKTRISKAGARHSAPPSPSEDDVDSDDD